MGQHAKRFTAVNAQKGTGLRAVADQLKVIADITEDWFDPNSSEVVGAMQYFEQGLGRLSVAPANPEMEQEPDDEKATEKPARGRKSATPKSGDASEDDAKA